MTNAIRKVTVIGAGAMGSGIAAHLANAGIAVHLLDIVPKGATDKNVVAKGAIERMKAATLETDPLSAGFMDPSNAKRITVGNLEDDLEKAVGESDWVIEVIIEDLGIKQRLFAQIDKMKKPGAIVTSNTSTIPLKDLIEGRSDDFKKSFAITHFFNPPRLMRLLELISGEHTAPEVTKTLRDFCDINLGKKVVECNDSPAFIANRIGTYFMFRTIVETLNRKMKVEDADAIVGKPLGFPKDGVFGLLDLVGIGITPHLTESLQRTLPVNDPFRQIDSTEAMKIIHDMLKDGRSGRRSPKGGFYRMHRHEDGTKVKQVLDLQSGEYRTAGKDAPPAAKAGKKGLKAVFETGDDSSAMAWVVMRDTLLYAASLVPSVTDNIADVDAAMREGYNWKKGPFEMLDTLGLDWFAAKVKADGLTLPPVLALAGTQKFYTTKNNAPAHMTFDFAAGTTGYAAEVKPDGVLSLADIKRNTKPLVSHHSASLWDAGDGVACFEFHSKMNTLDPSVLHALNESIKFIGSSGGKYKAMVVYNDAENFSFGANIGLVSAGFGFARSKFAKAVGISGLIERGMYKVMGNLIFQGQAVYRALREAPFPVVGAPAGRALGGGCEILLHCDAIQAHAETYMGLVESGIGIIPGWGGCGRVLERVAKAQQAGFVKPGPFPPVRQAFMALMMPQFAISMSGQDAKKKLWLSKGDGITMNRDRLLADAKAKALSMAPDYKPPAPAVFQLPGESAATSIKTAVDDMYLAGQVTYHDVVVADALAKVVTGGKTHIGTRVSESELSQLERESFMSLMHTRDTQKRIDHTFKNGKPLREGPTDRTLDEIRANRESITLPTRPMDGKPLDGKEGRLLRWTANVTAQILKRLG